MNPGTPLLLLHGAIGASDQLLPLANAMKNTCPVYLMDFSGHGKNPDTNTNFSIEQFAEEVLDFVDKMGMGPINIFGYSMGGYVALYLALHHPSRIHKVMTLATKFNWNPEVALAESKMLNEETIAAKLPEFASKLSQRHGTDNWKKVLQKTRTMMLHLGDHPTLSQDNFKSISTPVLFTLGENDKMVSLEETIAVSQELPNGSLFVFPHTKHPIESVNTTQLADRLNFFFRTTNLS